MGLSHHLEVAGLFLPEGRTNWFTCRSAELAFLPLLLLLYPHPLRQGLERLGGVSLWLAMLCLNYQCWESGRRYFLASKVSTARAAWGGSDVPGCRVTTIWCLLILRVSAHFFFFLICGTPKWKWGHEEGFALCYSLLKWQGCLLTQHPGQST